MTSMLETCCLGHMQGSKHRRSFCWDCQHLTGVQSMLETKGLSSIPRPLPIPSTRKHIPHILKVLTSRCISHCQAGG